MTDIVQRLTPADLSSLAAALRSGRLAAPFSEVAVKRYCAGEVASKLVTEFEKLTNEGIQAKHLALLLDTVAETRIQARSVEDLVELVWTGPEAPGAANRDTSVVVRELFGSATSEVLVAGFAVYQGREVFRRLAERMAENPQLRVRLFLDVRRAHGDTSPASELVWKFLHRFRTSEWPGEKLPELFYDPRSLDENQEKRSSLHAKCIVIDRRVAFVTSANFTEAAQTRNIEVGSLIRSPVFAAELADHFDRLATTRALSAFPDCRG